MPHRSIPTPLDGKPVTEGMLTLSAVPPSLNNAFVNLRRGRTKSVPYRAWQTLASVDLRRQPSWHVPGAVVLRLTFARKETKADLDNLIKGTIDVLVASGRISDDRHVQGITAAFEDDMTGVSIGIWATALQARAA